MKVLLVGDTHCTAESIKECESLYNLIYESAVKYKPNIVVFCGDDLDSFGYPSIITQHFLVEQAQRLQELCPVVFILGNHSFSPNYPEKHSLLPLKFLKNTIVVDCPMSFHGMDFMPFRKDKYQFERETNSLPNNILFCHQPFLGAVYESGWEDEDGLEVEKVKHSTIISGHIHKSAQLGACWYPGSPRWLKKSDANEEKFIYIWDSENNDVFKISTWPAVTKMKALELTEKDVVPSLDEINTKYFVTLKGDFQFCQKTSNLIGNKAEIKIVLNKQKKSQVKQEDTIELSLKQYIDNNFNSKFDIPKDVLINEINKRLQK